MLNNLLLLLLLSSKKWKQWWKKFESLKSSLCNHLFNKCFVVDQTFHDIKKNIIQKFKKKKKNCYFLCKKSHGEIMWYYFPKHTNNVAKKLKRDRGWSEEVTEKKRKIINFQAKVWGDINTNEIALYNNIQS